MFGLPDGLEPCYKSRAMKTKFARSIAVLSSHSFSFNVVATCGGGAEAVAPHVHNGGAARLAPYPVPWKVYKAKDARRAASFFFGRPSERDKQFKLDNHAHFRLRLAMLAMEVAEHTDPNADKLW